MRCELPDELVFRSRVDSNLLNLTCCEIVEQTVNQVHVPPVRNGINQLVHLCCFWQV